VYELEGTMARKFSSGQAWSFRSWRSRPRVKQSSDVRAQNGGERGEKEHRLTGNSCASSGLAGKGQSCRILPEIGEEEVNVVVAVVDPGSIP
jgi:hypothetical protein